MYEFVTHTWNPIKGRCYHDCAYCYMKILVPNPQPIHFDESELNGLFSENQFIFIGSSTDVFASDVPSEWITAILDFCVEGNTTQVEFDNLEEVLAEEGVQLRIFGKPEIKGHRRMGVILATAETTEEALAKTARAYDKLKVTVL